MEIVVSKKLARFLESALHCGMTFPPPRSGPEFFASLVAVGHLGYTDLSCYHYDAGILIESVHHNRLSGLGKE